MAQQTSLFAVADHDRAGSALSVGEGGLTQQRRHGIREGAYVACPATFTKAWAHDLKWKYSLL